LITQCDYLMSLAI